MTTTSALVHDTPLGPLALTASERGLTRISYGGVRHVPAADDPVGPTVRAVLDLVRRELDEYFAGLLRQFSVPVDLRRVDVARRHILDGLADVGYGETTTYGELAARLGLVDDGPRRVGVAMARNPVAIVVPCHRVLGAGGALTGYGGGLAAKQALLDLEARDRPGQLTIAI
jgi:methylated-DNA-[protein]-cysteine S-methyltransferase